MPRRIDKIREAGVNELEAQQKELVEQIFRLRFQMATGQAEALRRLRESRKDLARVKTLLRAQSLPNAATTKAVVKHVSTPKSKSGSRTKKAGKA